MRTFLRKPGGGDLHWLRSSIAADIPNPIPVITKLPR